MAKVYAITNQKGGVGKTITAINLAAAAAQDPSKMVVLLGIDPQGHATEGVSLSDWYLDEGISVYDAIVPNHRRKASIVVADLIKKVPGEKFLCIPENYMLQVAEKELYPLSAREKQIDLLIQQLDDVCDEIFIDCPPNLGPLTDCAIYAARRGRGGLVVPVQAEKSSVKALELLTDQLEMLERTITDDNGKIKIDVLAIVPNMYSESTISRSILSQMKTAFPDLLTSFVFPRKVAVPEAYDQGRSIFTYEPKIGDKSQKRRDAEEMQQLYLKIVEMVRAA